MVKEKKSSGKCSVELRSPGVTDTVGLDQGTGRKIFPELKELLMYEAALT